LRTKEHGTHLTLNEHYDNDDDDYDDDCNEIHGEQNMKFNHRVIHSVPAPISFKGSTRKAI